jgi:hypothetical protein
MRRAVVCAAAALLASPAPGGETGSTTLAELARRAEAVVVGRAVGSPSPGTVRFQIEEGIRGWTPFADVRAFPGVADEFDPSGAQTWLLYLGRPTGGLRRVLGGERGAVPLVGDAGLDVLEAARALAPLADLPDERLRDALAAQIRSASPRVREDAGEALSRLPRALLRGIAPSLLAEALAREEGPTPSRGAILRVLAARAEARDLPALRREVEEGPEELFPLLAEPLRSIEGGASTLALAFRGLPRSRRLATIRLLGEVGGSFAREILRAVLAGSDPEARLAAIEAMGAFPGNGEDLLLALSTGVEAEARAAVRAILLAGNGEDRALLRALAGSIPAARALLESAAADPFSLLQSRNR